MVHVQCLEVGLLAWVWHSEFFAPLQQTCIMYLQVIFAMVCTYTMCFLIVIVTSVLKPHYYTQLASPSSCHASVIVTSICYTCQVLYFVDSNLTFISLVLLLFISFIYLVTGWPLITGDEISWKWIGFHMVLISLLLLFGTGYSVLLMHGCDIVKMSEKQKLYHSWYFKNGNAKRLKGLDTSPRHIRHSLWSFPGLTF